MSSEAIVLCGFLAILGFCLGILAATYKTRSAFAAAWKEPKPAAVPEAQPPKVERAPSLGDSASQLRHVMAASFYKKRVMSKEEYRVFKVVETEVRSVGKGLRVLSQTSLGEIIGSDDTKAFNSVNAKRVDVLIIGPYGEPVAAFEYQGGGHHQGSAAARDAIKREALRRAGVHFVEVLDNHSPDEIAQLVRRIFRDPQAEAIIPQRRAAPA
jgi:hypothetical protein